MASQAFLGNKIRRLRKDAALTQVQLAERLSISASYLNLIEKNHRALTVPLLLKLAEIFELDLQQFADDDEAQLVSDLREAFSDTIFARREIRDEDLRELVANAPTVSRSVLDLYRAFRKSRQDAQTLSTKLSDGEALFGLEASRLPTEEVSDVIRENGNYFPDLEEAAEKLWREEKLKLGALLHGLIGHLEREHRVAVQVQASDVLEGAVRRFHAKRRKLFLSEVLPPSSLTFQVAHQVGLLSLGPIFDSIVDTSSLSTNESRNLCRVALANYFAGAVLMPYDRFLAAAQSLRYDLELLEHRFRASFEQVCHRLTSLAKPGARGIPFHIVRIDIAGNISKKFSGSGIPFARYSGACTRANVHAAFMTPGVIRQQLSMMTDGMLYFSVARTVRKAGGGHLVPASRLAIELGCKAKDAKEMVYADGFDLESGTAAVPIGVTCRLCDRMDCRQRAFPPMHHRLEVDENERGLSFYYSPPRTNGR